MSLTATQRDALSLAFGEAVSFSEAQRRLYGQTVSALRTQFPDAVLTCSSVAQVQALVRLALEHRMPIVPFGAGTSLEGQVNCPEGGVCIDLRGLNEILCINEADMYAIVQPGVTRKQLNDALRHTGLMFATDPGTDATLGGMASTRASGTTTIRYGSMRENVIAAEVVTGRGETIQVGKLAAKSAAGYELLPLFVGAEGTLGIFTRLTIRLHPVPSAIVGGTASFETVDRAVEAVIDARMLGLPVARIELLDELGVAACNRYSRLELPEQPHLFVELHGELGGLKVATEEFGRVVGEKGGRFSHASSLEDRSRLWRARHDAWWAIHAQFPGLQGATSDVCVPMSRLAEAVRHARGLLVAHALRGVIVGHVGDGNFHVLVMHDRDDPAECDRLDSFLDGIARHAITLGGTCTGEHGIGQAKRELLAVEHGSALNVMREIKRLLDPHDIMNPGKIFLASMRSQTSSS